MFKLYVVWPSGAGYTKDFSYTEGVVAEVKGIYESGDVPAVLSVTYLDDDVAESVDETVPFGRVQVGQSAVHGTKVRD